MSIKIPYMRKEKSTLLAFSAIALLLASPLALFNLVPARAQSNLSFRTPTAATGTVQIPSYEDASITFDAQGESFTTPDKLEVNGTFQITSGSGQILYSGSVSRVQANSGFANVSDSGKQIIVFSDSVKPSGYQIEISTSCSTSASNKISVTDPGYGDVGDFSGAVECSSQGGGGDTAAQQSSPSMTGTTTQDSDGDGIPDSSDRCTHNSNPRCFKEGKASTTNSTTTTTTHEQQPPSTSSSSSSSRGGN
ncbi:MAG: hypothetical protein ACJ71D_00255 [Nitrososphaera sp.]